MGVTFALAAKVPSLYYLYQCRNASNALHKHQSSDHPNLQPQFEASVIRGGFQWNLERQIFEALEIESQKGNPNVTIVNSKSEWGNRGLPRLVATE